MTGTTATEQYARLGGVKKLTLVDAVAQSIGFMGPVFVMAFLVPLLVGLNASGKGAGAAAPLSVRLADQPRRWAVYLAAAVGTAVTGGAIFGSVYKVHAPTICAAYAAIATFVIGLVLAFLAPGRAGASTEFRELTEAEQGPVKL